MQTYTNPLRGLRYISILLIYTFILSGILPVTLVQADDGDFDWAKAMGGTSSDTGNAISVDTSGNVYTTGNFMGTADFDPGPGTFYLISAGDSDIFISKLDSNGNFAWAKAMGGTSWDYGSAISVDTSGNIYTTGIFYGTADFDPSPGTFNLTSAGDSDIFINKIDSNGNFAWAKAMGGTEKDYGNGISVDASGNVYTTGYFIGIVDFDPGPGTFNLTSAGSNDIFISKLDSNGNFVWAKAMGGASWDYGSAISVDTSGNVYTTGTFNGTVDFNPGPGTFNLTSAGDSDIFISKLDSNGNFAWAKAMGGIRSDIGTVISVDTSGNVYTTGVFYGTVDFDPGPGTFNLINAADSEAIFISKLDSNGNFVWARAMRGTSWGRTCGLSVDTSGNVYTTGYFPGTVDFDPGPGTCNLTTAGDLDIFISKLDSNGNFICAKAMGGSRHDYGNGISVDASGNVYTTGNFMLTVDFDPGSGTFKLTSAGSHDIFIVRLSDFSPCSCFPWPMFLPAIIGDQQ